MDIQNLNKSVTVGINALTERMENEGSDIYRFGFGHVESPFPVPEIMQDALLNRNDYNPCSFEGLPQLCTSIARHHKSQYGLDVSGDDVFVSSGSTESMFLLQCVYNGQLLLPSPSWVSYDAHRPVRWIPTSASGNWKVTPLNLMEAIETDPSLPRILVLNSPNNPTGSVYTSCELEILAEVCRRYNVIVLSDEIYSHVTHTSEPCATIATYYPEGTIISSGVSKWAGAGDWMLGYFVFPKQLRWLQDAMTIAAAESYTCVSAPIQHAAIVAYDEFESSEIQSYLKNERKVLQGLAHYGVNKLREANIEVIHPNGGFYAFPNFSSVPNIHKMKEKWAETHGKSPEMFGSKEMTRFLVEETGVTALGGAYFGRDQLELTMRLAYVDFDGETVMSHAYEIPDNHTSPLMAEFLEKYCFRTLRGFDRLNDYFSSL